MTTTDSGYVLDARQGKALNDKIHTVEILEGIYPTTSVANGAVVDIATLTIAQPGNYIAYGGYSWSAHFEGKTMGRIDVNGSQASTQTRSTGDSGGGYNACCIFAAGTGTNTVKLRAFQNSGSTRTVQSITLRALRVSK